MPVGGVGLGRPQGLDLEQADSVGSQVALERLDECPANTTPAHGSVHGHQVDLGRRREVPGGQEHANGLLFFRCGGRLPGRPGQIGGQVGRRGNIADDGRLDAEPLGQRPQQPVDRSRRLPP
jgi:hypothetical protein